MPRKTSIKPENRIARNGLIYFPDFCKLVLDTFREEKAEEEQFRRNMFKAIIKLKVTFNIHLLQQKIFAISNYVD